MEDIKSIQAQCKAINDLSVSDIDLFENGKRVEILESVRDDFGFTGLRTIDFFTSGWYLRNDDKRL